MLLGALLIGLITAYYFGVRPGIIAGAASAVLLILAEIIPGLALGAYGLIAVFVAGVVFMGQRLAKKREEDGADKVRRMARKALGKVWKWL